jgi:hypothetical protein
MTHLKNIYGKIQNRMLQSPVDIVKDRSKIDGIAGESITVYD